jgi:hypothetical protein
MFCLKILEARGDVPGDVVVIMWWVQVQQQGVGLRLTKCNLQAVSLVQFDMEVRGQLPADPAASPILEMLAGGGERTHMGQYLHLHL